LPVQMKKKKGARCSPISMILPQFVRDLVEKVDEQGKKWYGSRNMKVPFPGRYPTPYGGRLVWTLPGQTKIICHLKDKNKIRHKKRWSQCMYMYYFLGEEDLIFLLAWDCMIVK
jgi:chitin synthase